MEKADILETDTSQTGSHLSKPCSTKQCAVIAAGVFGHSLRYNRVYSFTSKAGYIRELEQLPNYTPPSVDRFVAQYVRSNIGITKSSS